MVETGSSTSAPSCPKSPYKRSIKGRMKIIDGTSELQNQGWATYYKYEVVADAGDILSLILKH